MRLGCILNKKGDTAHLPYCLVVFENKLYLFEEIMNRTEKC